MALERVHITEEIHEGSGRGGMLMLCDALEGMERLLKTHEGQIKLIYMDPPYQTGETFRMRVRVGSDDWKSGRGSLPVKSFSDNLSRDDYYGMMRRAVELAKQLLREDGMLFLHIDYRTHPYLRIIGDEVFGPDNFLNEIIWCYQTGGRSMRHFSRKHDVILFYRKSEQHDFNVSAVMAPPQEPRSNHMKRHVDPDGRVYRSIRSGGKVYTYYDDEPVAPSDVWADVSHLQQKDPERTGYDTQKPLALLNRIVRCGVRPGDLVLDSFAGSGTTLEAAKLADCEFIGFDTSRLTLNIARRRLDGAAYTLCYPETESEPECSADVETGVGFYHVKLLSFNISGEQVFAGLDAVDNWSVGYIRDEKYTVCSQSLRSKKTPEISRVLDLPVFSGSPVMNVCDVYGNSYCYRLPIDD